jgi:hypothetical protein
MLESVVWPLPDVVRLCEPGVGPAACGAGTVRLALLQHDGALSVSVPVRARRLSTGEAPYARAGQQEGIEAASPVPLCTPPRSGEAKAASPVQRRRLLSCSSSDNLCGLTVCCNCSSRARTLTRSCSMDSLSVLHRPESPAPCRVFRRSRWCRDLVGGDQSAAETPVDCLAYALAGVSASADSPTEVLPGSPDAVPQSAPLELGDIEFEFGLEW